MQRDSDPVARALRHVRERARGAALPTGLRVTLNFHPDRLIGGVPILRAIARDGSYRSQFETGTSNGGLTAHPGGDRWLWESRIFGGAYDDADARLRPKYGALNRRGLSYGGARRFGSSHLRLSAHTLERTTFCFPDSVFEPEDFGVHDAYRLSALADAAAPITPGADEADPLDDYVEAQVHGVLDLARDAEALVLDPSFRDTEVHGDAAALADTTGLAIEWHAGFELDVETLRAHPAYRGPEFVRLGEELAVDGTITPAVIGTASRSGRHDEQSLKRVWHYVARFGYRGT